MSNGNTRAIKNRFMRAAVCIVLLLCMFASVAPMAIGVKAEETCPAGGIFKIDDDYGVGLRLDADGGMRFVLKMDDTVKDYIVKNSDVTLSFVIAPKSLMPTDEKYLDMDKKIVVNVDKDKIFRTGDFWYANGCVVNMLEENRKYDYTAVALIQKGNTVERVTKLNTGVYGNFYDIANRALLYTADGTDYARQMLSLGDVYEWVGSEQYPIEITTDAQYRALVEKINAGIALESKYINLNKFVDRTPALDEGKQLAHVTEIVGNPVIRIGNDVQEMDVLVGATYDLPTVSAETFDGKTISDIAIIPSDAGKVQCENGKITVSETGKYTVRYTAVDSRDDSLTESRELTVNVYRNLTGIANGRNEGVDFTTTFGPDAEQTVTVNTGNFVFNQFYGEGGKVYYAEGVFTFPADMDFGVTDNYIGFAHSVKGDISRALTFSVDRRDRNFKIKDMDTVNDTDWTEWGERKAASKPILYCYQLTNYRKLVDTNANEVKFAVMRDGAFFYAFINDQYIGGVNSSYYADKDTLPGIFGLNMEKATVSNIVCKTGEEARAQFKTLTGDGSKLVCKYVPASWAAGSANDANLSYHEAADGKDAYASFDNIDATGNSGLISPYMWFEGDFTFEWEYKNTKQKNDYSRVWLEIRPYTYTDDFIRFASTYKPAGGTSSVFVSNEFQNEDEGKVWASGCQGFDGKDGKDDYGMKFRVTRRIVTQGEGESAKKVAKYTFEAIPYVDANKTEADASKCFTYEYTFTGYNGSKKAACDPTAPVLVLWHNQEVTGEFSNLKWWIPEDTNV